MKNIKFTYRIIALILILTFTINTSLANGSAIYYPSSWASQKLAISLASGIITERFDTLPFDESITRRDFSELLINTCNTYGITLPEPSISPPFSDTNDIVVDRAYMLGLTQGTSNGIFSPNMPLTREMAAVMLSRLRMLFQGTVSKTSTGMLSYTAPMDEQQASQLLSKYSSDSNLVSDWAETYMADVYTRGILLGTGEGYLDPKSNITREQAVMLSLNILSYSDEAQIRAAGVKECVLPVPSGIFIADSYYSGDVYLSWNNIPLATAYDITVFKNGTASYTTKTDKNYLDLRTSKTSYNRDTKSYDTTQYDNPLYTTIFGNDNKSIRASLEVVPVNSKGNRSIFSLTQSFTIETWANQNERIFGDSAKTYFESNEEALLHMTSITVNSWKLTSSGNKITFPITLTVNKNVAEDIKNIFEDIYNGEEKFPIKSYGAYAYRTGRSEHSSGTAIDINSNENYFVEWNGTIKVGALWEPGTNPYSIPADGDVVRAFNRYGWKWSPDMRWDSGADYMHFSLGGK